MKDESDEPLDLTALHEEASTRPPSILVLGLLLVVFFVGGLSFFGETGDFRPDVFANSPAGGDAGTPADPQALGKRIFARNCAVCHQADGEGLPGSFPPLAGSEWVLGQEKHGDNHLVRIVLQGLQGPVTVRGKTFQNTMVPWGQVLKDEEIAAVLDYIRTAWGNTAPPITPDFVARIRGETAARTEPWTQAELEAIPREAAHPAAAARSSP